MTLMQVLSIQPIFIKLSSTDSATSVECRGLFFDTYFLLLNTQMLNLIESRKLSFFCLYFVGISNESKIVTKIGYDCRSVFQIWSIQPIKFT